MSRRLRRRIDELERAAREAEAAAAELVESERSRHAAASADAERLNRLAIEGLRHSYDLAMAESGTVLFQQVSPSADSYYVSESVRGVFGWDPDAFLAAGIFRGMVHPHDLEIFDAALSQQVVEQVLDDLTVIDLTTGSASPLVQYDHHSARRDVSIRFRASDGTWKRVLVRSVDRAANGPVAGSMVSVDEFASAVVTIEHFAEIVEHDSAGSLVLEFLDSDDPNSLVLRDANPAGRRLVGLEDGSIDGLPLDAVLGGSSAQLVRSALFDVLHTGESMTAERLSFSEIPGTYLDLRVLRLRDGAVAMTLDDVTNTVAMETRLRRQASHDALTGLPNRSLFEERLDVAIDRVSPGAPVALVLIDIDGLERVNESYGIHAGDELLVQMGRRLVQGLRGVSVVSRLGEDEFGVLTLPCSGHAEAVSCAANVQAELSRPFEIAGHLVECKVSIGVALAPDHGDDGRTLLRNASTALQDDKNAGGQKDRGFTVFHRSADSTSIRRLAVLSELRQSLANQDLELRFQPQVDLRTGTVTKIEAVPHWLHDDDPTRMSVELLELAEQSGLVLPLTRWTLTEAARAIKSLASRGGANPFGDSYSTVVSVNISAKNLFDPDLMTFLELIIRSGELDTNLIELEVSETGLVEDPAASMEVLGQLASMGVRFVVDEFGTGYTSLSTMRHLPVVGLKIDRSYLSTISTSASDAAIVRSTIELSHELGLSVCASGVADADTLALLVEFGCDLAQGSYLAAPTRLDDLGHAIEGLESALRGWLGAGATA